MTSSHSFHSLEAEKEPICFTFGHAHTGMTETTLPPSLSVVTSSDTIMSGGLHLFEGHVGGGVVRGPGSQG